METTEQGPRSTRCRVCVLALLWSAVAVAAADDEPALDSPSQQRAPSAFADEKPEPVLDWGRGAGRSLWVPAFDILLFDTLLNQFNRRYSGVSDYDADWDSIRDNLEGDWVYDSDRFDINQIGHPYQGSMYQGFARSAGLGFWESMAYTVVGSAAWEIAGETTPPSVNDQITTGFGGSFLGESLFRMASLLLESGDGRPGLWRELGAAAISPSTGFNRLAFGDRFDGVFRSHDPAAYTRIDIGMNLASSVKSDVNTNRDVDGPVTPQSYREGEALADFTLAYGLPGKPGYRYERPFDYFHFQLTAASSNALENVIVRGLLAGRGYAWGERYRGIWGLYGNFDYIAPQIFRVSTSSLGLGTTAQTWLSRRVALQGTAMAGAGYGSAGTVRSGAERDYHSGLSAQGLLALRLIFGDRVSLDLTARDYRVTDIAAQDEGGREHILRGDISLTWRIHKLHGLTLKYVASRRDAEYGSGRPDSSQEVGVISLGYTYLGQTRAGAVDWRPRRDGGS